MNLTFKAKVVKVVHLIMFLSSPITPVPTEPTQKHHQYGRDLASHTRCPQTSQKLGQIATARNSGPVIGFSYQN